MENEPQNSEPKKGSLGAVLFPMGLAAILVIGYYLGTLQQGNNTSIPGRQSEFVKLNRVLDEIELKYVDTIKQDALIESSIAGILQKLDPHSSYIPAKDLTEMDEPLKGSFGGIGIRFMILRDTLVVTNVVDNGPAKQNGMKAGDRIISIDGENVAGIGLKNSDVFDQLKGPMGTPVKVGVKRNSDGSKKTYDIIRGAIPIKSVESTQMVTSEIGYIKLARFAETTPLEFYLSAQTLKTSGMKKLILDLRDNGGGYLTPAVELADHFLKDGKMIVYTEGRYNGRTDYFATSSGLLEDVEVAVLINASSASAAEILAGAIQDNDHGVVLGRRSYGKGLVQEPIPLTDGSAIRLTVARYYTPAGRCIQKPYGEGVDYHADYTSRYQNGEFYGIDSSALEELEKFKTPGGKTVYGGGGIFPDVFIPLDTAGASQYLTSLAYTPAFTEFSFEYVDQHRKELSKFKSANDFDLGFTITEKLFNDFTKFAAEAHEVEIEPYGIVASKERIKTRLKAHIAQNVWEQSGWFTVFIKKDKEVIKAIEEIEKL